MGNKQNRRAYVLHKRSFRETSLLVDLFCHAEGRIRVVAKGARSKGGNKRFFLELFMPLLLTWTGKSELKTLLSAEIIGSGSRALTGQKLYLGLYINELLSRLLIENDPHEYLYQCYSNLLEQLMSPDLSLTEDVEPLLREFELTLLEEIGYGLPLTTDASSGETVKAGEKYYLTNGEGFTRLTNKTSTGRESFLGDHLLHIAEKDYSDREVRRCAKRLLRHALAFHLGAKPLQSREFFRKSSAETINS